MQFDVSPSGLLTMTQDSWQWTLQGRRIGSQSSPGQPHAPAVAWDSRLDRRGVTLHLAAVSPGQSYWRLIRADYRDRSQAQGKHHIYVEALDASSRRAVGARAVGRWDRGETTILIEAKPGEEAGGNLPMFAAGYGYRVKMDGVSDEVRGMGLGDIGSEHMAEHVSYLLIFQWTTA